MRNINVALIAITSLTISSIAVSNVDAGGAERASAVAQFSTGNAELPGWLATRAQRYKRWRAVHSNVERSLVILMAKTAKLIRASEKDTAIAQTSPSSPPIIWRVKGGLDQLWESLDAPELVIIPAGEFSMGSTGVSKRLPGTLPVHRVRIAYPLAVGKFPVTKGEFALFVKETAYDAKHGKCWSFDQAKNDYVEIEGANWESPPGFSQTLDEPAVCVNQYDAKSYVAWLARRTGKKYRLLSESEWEYAARAGTTTARPWGEEASHDYANYGEDVADQCCLPKVAGRDRWEHTSPVGSFPPNKFGLYDMLGNVWQRLDDCYHTNYDGAPADGSAWMSGKCDQVVLRGSGWAYGSLSMSSAARGRNDPNYRVFTDGFRVAREL